MADEDEEDNQKKSLIEQLSKSRDKLSEVISTLSKGAFGEKDINAFSSLVLSVESRVNDLHEQVLESFYAQVVERQTLEHKRIYMESAELFVPLPSPTEVIICSLDV